MKIAFEKGLSRSPMEVPADPKSTAATMDCFRKILVPTNFSRFADCALQQAVALGQQCKASITLLHVLDLSKHALKYWGPIDPAKLEVETTCRAKERFSQMISALRNKGLEIKTLVREGLPYEEILAAAWDYDLMVLGKSEKPLWHIFSRRTVKGVLEAPPCRLLVVSDGKAEWIQHRASDHGAQDSNSGGHHRIENGGPGMNDGDEILGSNEGHI